MDNTIIDMEKVNGTFVPCSIHVDNMRPRRQTKSKAKVRVKRKGNSREHIHEMVISEGQAVEDNVDNFFDGLDEVQSLLGRFGIRIF